MSNSTPQIRFKGYTDAWEKRKLGEVAEFSKGSGYSKGDLTDEGTPIILYGRLYTKYETIIEDVDTFANMKDKSVISHGGEVIVPSSGETAEDISRASVVGKDGVILGGDLNIVRADSTIDPAFLAITISNGNQQKELSKRAQGKSVVHISNSDLKDVVLQHPTLPEQTRIGKFFATLDSTITLYKQKLDGLRTLKKGYLQQMFPQAGERVPRVRFDGFEGDWESRKLGKIAETYSGGTPSAGKKDYYGGNIPFIRSAEINAEGTELFLTEDGLKNSSAKMVEVGTILYALYGATSGEVGRSKIVGAINQAILAIKPTENYDANYVSQWLRAQKDSIVSTYLQGGQGNLSAAIIKELAIAFPAIDEQTAIGKFFHTLDEQITVQQSKVEQLQQLKKAYLQNMFI